MCSLNRLLFQFLTVKYNNCSKQVENNDYRTYDDSWCVCGRCTVMTTVTECICCKEISAVRTQLDSCPSAHCITQHDRFVGVCLEREVLRAVLALLHDVQNSRFEEPITNRFLYTSIDFINFFVDL